MLQTPVRSTCASGALARPPAVHDLAEPLGNDLHFVAGGSVMQQIRARLSLVASIDVPVLLLGESGTGKEVLARLIHKLSARAERMFLKVNCAAVPPDLLESELFGYEPGAFTGATHAKPGKFELCDHGTLFLDEIGEMPVVSQAKLLHVLQDQQFSRLGGHGIRKVDVRIIAATNVDMPEAISSKQFREDLYYRLSTFPIHIPPLREHKEDIPVLLRHFMNRYATLFGRPPLPFSVRLVAACMRYPWPGNIRELESFVKRYVIFRNEDTVLAQLESDENENRNGESRPLQRPPLSPEGTQKSFGDLKQLVRTLKREAEREAIAWALREANWHREKAARLLNISYKALRYKIHQYGIGSPESRLTDNPAGAIT